MFMLKKITMLLVFNLIAVHSGFAMEKEVKPRQPFNKFNGINVRFGRYNKDAQLMQDLNSQMQKVKSGKNNLTVENDQIKRQVVDMKNEE